MVRSLYAIPAMLCVTAALVTAQAPAGEKPAPQNPPAAEQPRAQQPPARPAESSASAANKVTYTGCVKPGATPGTWILENAEAASKAGAAAPGAVGTSGGAKTTFSLDPAASVNLTPHANHKVEVVGMVSPAKAGPDAGASAPKQAFNVESLKMVSPSCP